MLITFLRSADRFAVWTGASSDPYWSADTQSDLNWNIISTDTLGTETAVPGAIADFDGQLYHIEYRAADSQTALTVEIHRGSEAVSGSTSYFDDSFTLQGVDPTGSDQALIHIIGVHPKVFVAQEKNEAGDDITVTLSNLRFGEVGISRFETSVMFDGNFILEDMTFFDRIVHIGLGSATSVVARNTGFGNGEVYVKEGGTLRIIDGLTSGRLFAAEGTLILENTSNLDDLVLNDDGQLIATGAGTVLNENTAGRSALAGTGNNRVDIIDGATSVADLYLGWGNDTLISETSIDGDVDMGTGDNVVDISGILTGIVETYSGDDTVMVDATTTGRMYFGVGDDEVTFKGHHTGSYRLSYGRDTIVATDGNELIVAGQDDDIIEGGGGADRLFGRDGADTFVFKVGDSTFAVRDNIVDFSRADGDKIDLTAVASSFSDSGFTGTAGEVIFVNDRIKVDIDGDGRADMNILVRNATLDVDDFIF